MSNLREAAQQALDEIECDLFYLFGRASNEGHESGQRLALAVRKKMSTARAVLAKPDDKAQPVAWMDEFGNTFPLAAYQLNGKPMSWAQAHKRNWKPLYTTPQPPFKPDWMNYKQGFADGKAEAENGAELSDGELYKMACLSLGNVPAARYRKDWIGLMRAVIAADRAARGGAA